VLYHAPDPLGYLKRVRSVTKGYAIIETLADFLDVDRPALAYFPGESLNNDGSNHFAPNMAALVGMLRDAGFSRVDEVSRWRAHEVERLTGRRPPWRGQRSARLVVRAWV
jgi:hypothetical protein